MSASRSTLIVVAGALANKPYNGGEAWVRLSWLSGFRELGFRVFFLEQIDPSACVDAVGAPASFAQSVNRRYFAEVVEHFALVNDAALICGATGETYGASQAHLATIAEEAALLVNISGHLPPGPIFDRFGCRVYVDIDPGFTQFWQAAGNRGARLADHHAHFTIAENIGQSDCTIPTCGIAWRPVRQPVVLSQWPVTSFTGPPRLTTLSSWRGSFGSVEYKGKVYGTKAHEFRKYIDVPRRVAAAMEIALSIHPGDERDRRGLVEHGWHLADPRAVAAMPEQFRQYVQGSAAEFSVAQGVYADTHSGWFSDRTTRYLASGKPAVVQDTGWSRYLLSDAGLLGFTTPDEAAEGIARVTREYDSHARAARVVAEEYFDARHVLPNFLADLGIKCAGVAAR